MIKSFWDGLGDKFGHRGRAGFMAGIALIALAFSVAGYWLFRSDFQVLFADLTPQDTAAMTAELDRLKIPYMLADQGNNAATILVEKSEVYKTRIKLMGKDIPLHGAVGFELFNNSDFGMTEFAQKMNYQRAMQGELTRTILSLAEIREARVLLALPEQGLFKQAGSKSKASVAITLKQGQVLRPEQVIGIQRLVAAAVPEIVSKDVTIVDQNGVALTRPGDGETDTSTGATRLDLKKDTEAYLSRKATAVLEQALGMGQALASVDVTLNMDSMQSSLDEVVGAPGKLGSATTGVVVRERETTREMGAPLDTHLKTEINNEALRGSMQREVEYTVGHRVEHVVSQPGQIRRIQIAIVVKKSLNSAQKEQLAKTIAASVGASSERGDTVVVQTLEELNPPTTNSGAVQVFGHVDEGKANESAGPPSRPLRGYSPDHWPPRSWMASLGLLLMLLVLGGFWQWRNLSRAKGARLNQNLSEAQRQAALAKVQFWLHGQSEDKASAKSTMSGEVG